MRPSQLILTSAALALAFPALSVSAQVVSGPDAACLNFDGSSRFFSADGSAGSADLARLNGPVSTEQNVPQALPVLLGFSLSEAATLRLSAIADGGGDPVLAVRDASGAMLAYNDDGPQGLDSEVITTLDPGNYCAVIGTYGPDAARIRAEVERVDTNGVSNPLTIPANLAPGACFDGAPAVAMGETGPDGAALTASTSVEASYQLSFRLSGETAVEITAANASADPVLALLDTNGTVIDENDDDVDLNSRILAEPLAPGEWCLELDALADPALAILVTVTPVSSEDIAMSQHARGETPPSITSPYPVHVLGELHTTTRASAQLSEGAWWGRFTVPERSLIELDAPEFGSLDPVMRLFTPGGTMLFENDDYGDDLGARIYAELDPGDYMVTVYHYDHNVDASASDAQLTLTRYIRAEE